MTATAPLLQVRDVVKDFGGVRAVDHCSLEVMPGTITGLIGPNGIGSRLLRFAEARLAELGCIKVNLQIVEGNEAAVLFYERHGYETEPRISMGKRLLSG